MTLSINDLYARAVSGDQASEQQLFSCLSERFRAFAHHRVWNAEDAAEIVQDALTVIASEYRGIAFESSFQAWAYKVLDNRILGYIKKRKQSEGKHRELDEGTVAHEADPEFKRRLVDCTRKLLTVNRRYGRILNLGYQGYSVPEMCERLSISKNNLYVILSRARSLLEMCLQAGRIEA